MKTEIERIQFRIIIILFVLLIICFGLLSSQAQPEQHPLPLAWRELNNHLVTRIEYGYGFCDIAIRSEAKPLAGFAECFDSRIPDTFIHIDFIPGG